MKAVIFDLDGTLVNTIDDLAAATNQALEMHGYPAKPLADFPLMVGNGSRKLQERCAGRGLHAGRARCGTARIFWRYTTKLHEPFRPYTGMEEVVQRLENRWRGG